MRNCTQKVTLKKFRLDGSLEFAIPQVLEKTLKPLPEKDQEKWNEGETCDSR